MIPDMCDSTTDNVCVAEVNSNQEIVLPYEPIVEQEVNPFTPRMIISSVLERLPRHNRHWEKFLDDMIEYRNQRANRMENESIDDFLLRYPIS